MSAESPFAPTPETAERLARALKPFADEAAMWVSKPGSRSRPYISEGRGDRGSPAKFTRGDLVRAVEALAAYEAEGGKL